MILLNFVMVVLLSVTLLTTYGYNVPVGIVIPIAIGIMFVIIGNYLPKIKPNYIFGIRLPWTLANEIVWTKTHRFGGWCFLIMGLLFIIGVILPVPYNFLVPITAVLVGVIIIAVYSYQQFKRIVK